MKKVIIVGSFAPYRDDPLGAEIWGVNFAYRHQQNVTRVYAADPMKGLIDLDEGFVQDLNALDIPVYLQEEHPDVPKSRTYPLTEMLRVFFNSDPEKAYFTSTIAYMFAHAIAEGYERIRMHRVLVGHLSDEFWAQKACLDFWLGVAEGRGIQVTVSGDSQLGKPYPWQPRLYGYQEGYQEILCNEIVKNAFKTVTAVFAAGARLTTAEAEFAKQQKPVSTIPPRAVKAA